MLTQAHLNAIDLLIKAGEIPLLTKRQRRVVALVLAGGGRSTINTALEGNSMRLLDRIRARGVRFSVSRDGNLSGSPYHDTIGLDIGPLGIGGANG